MEPDETPARRVTENEARSRQHWRHRRLSSCIIGEGADGQRVLDAAEELLRGPRPDLRKKVFPSKELGDRVELHVHPRAADGEHTPQVYVLTGGVVLKHYADGLLMLEGADKACLTLCRKEGPLIAVERRFMNPSRAASDRSASHGSSTLGTRR